MIIIDGSRGGGAMLRVALALSAVTQTPFTMRNIRASRPKPGLRAQHRTAVETVAWLAGTQAEGAEVGASQVVFRPKALRGGRLEVDIGTAGSVTLLVQAALLPALFAPRRVSLAVSGGTDVSWSPPVDYTQSILLPLIARFAERVNLSTLKRGYYPRGGGAVELVVVPDREAREGGSIELLEQGAEGAVQGVSHATDERRAAAQARGALHLFPSARIDAVGVTAQDVGGGITLWSRVGEGILGADALSAPDVPPERTGQRAAQSLRDELAHGAPVDMYLADQLIPFIAIFGGAIRVPALTDHVERNLEICAAFDLPLRREGMILTKD